MARKVLTFGDLKTAPAGAFLKCTGECHGEYSATRGDYFMRGDSEPIGKCCGRVLRLMTKQTVYSEVPR